MKSNYKSNPLDTDLIISLKDVNNELNHSHFMWVSWISQRSKVFFSKPESISTAIVNYFKLLFNSPKPNRMKYIMPFIIHPSQSGFINSRISTNNILLASELLGEFNSSATDKATVVAIEEEAEEVLLSEENEEEGESAASASQGGGSHIRSELSLPAHKKADFEFLLARELVRSRTTGRGKDRKQKRQELVPH
ncbi:hypothetical protein M5K25_022944 [Dendrobium thyrsiflorum]|uniref:Uncharacterized protein n=1 Tax=Dendrobium thyrsiflorum TaxID=117978 RepID=A0ABD0U6Z1_DENTH